MKINKQSSHAVIYPFEDTRLHYDNEGGAYIYNYDGSLVLCIYEAEYGEDFWWTVFDANTYTVLDNMKFGLAGQPTLEKAIQNFLKKSIYANEFDIQQRAARKAMRPFAERKADFRAEFVPHWDMDYYAIDYKIYQIRNSLLDYLSERDERHPYMFMNWDFANTHGFDFGDYGLVYEGKINYVNEFESESKILEHIFEKFNLNHPRDFYGHSLSVSDVVEVNGRYFYCNDIGFVEFDPYDNSRIGSAKCASAPHRYDREYEIGDIIWSYRSPYGIEYKYDAEYRVVDKKYRSWHEDGVTVGEFVYQVENIATGERKWMTTDGREFYDTYQGDWFISYPRYDSNGSRVASEHYASNRKTAKALTLDMFEEHEGAFIGDGVITYIFRFPKGAQLEIHKDWEDSELWEWSLWFDYTCILSGRTQFGTPELALEDFIWGENIGAYKPEYSYYIDDAYAYLDVYEASNKQAGVPDAAINFPNPYQLLSRLQSDCEYVVKQNAGERNLWANSWQEQIETMRYLYDKCEQFEGYPEWISEADIDAYEDAFRERFALNDGIYASNKNATRHFTYAEMQELDDEIEGRELHNSSRLRYTTGTELM